jgi:DNA replication protein DnaC
MGESHIPRRWWALDKEQPMFSRLSRIVETAWVNDKGLLIEGPVGVGKTFAAMILLHRLLSRGASCLFVSVPDLADSLRKQTPLATVEKMKTVQHLVLDDLGAEYDKSGWWFSILYQIVNERYSNSLPTTATCNTFKQIEPRVLRRIAETAHVVTMERE